MTQISKKEKEDLLNKILESSEFRESKRYQDLLKYLVEKSEECESIKEMDIAIDVFGKDSNFDPSIDPLVRSYISNLRKKLEHYYLTTSEELKYKIEIPKGHYKVEYIPFKRGSNYNFKKHKWLYLAFGVIISIIFFYYLINKLPENHANSPNIIWTELLQNKNKITIVLGDYYILAEKNNPNRVFVRIPFINSEQDYENQIKKDPSIFQKYEKTNITYLRPSASLGLYEILKALHFPNINIKLASEVQWKDFEENNIIYIGTFKNLNKLDTLLTRTNIDYEIAPYRLSIINDKGEKIKSYNISWRAGNYQSDYSVIIKMQGYKNNSIIFLTGFSEIGIMESIRQSLDPKFDSYIQNYIHQKINVPLYFEMISLVEGVELTSFHSTIKHFQILTKK